MDLASYETDQRPRGPEVQATVDELRSRDRAVVVEAIRVWIDGMRRDVVGGDEPSLTSLVAWTPDDESDMVTVVSDAPDQLIAGFVDALLDYHAPGFPEEARLRFLRETTRYIMWRLQAVALMCDVLEEMGLADAPEEGDAGLAALDALIDEWERSDG